MSIISPTFTCLVSSIFSTVIVHLRAILEYRTSKWSPGKIFHHSLLTGSCLKIVMYRYYISKPNSYLVITGAGVDNVKIKKKAFVFPFQKVSLALHDLFQ